MSWYFNTNRVYETETGKTICLCEDKQIGALISATPDLLAALETLLFMDVKGHQLADRLQFSDSGREILHQCIDAISRAKESNYIDDERN